MQNAGLNMGEYMLLSVPIDMLEEAGICSESVIQMRAQKGQIIIDAVRDMPDCVCDTDCMGCPCEAMCIERGVNL